MVFCFHVYISCFLFHRIAFLVVCHRFVYYSEMCQTVIKCKAKHCIRSIFHILASLTKYSCVGLYSNHLWHKVNIPWQTFRTKSVSIHIDLLLICCQIWLWTLTLLLSSTKYILSRHTYNIYIIVLYIYTSLLWCSIISMVNHENKKVITCHVSSQNAIICEPSRCKS